MCDWGGGPYGNGSYSEWGIEKHQSPVLPHIYFFQGRWWESKNGLDSFRKGITLNDGPRLHGIRN